MTESPGSLNRAVIVYDGECPVCIRAVEWVKERSFPDAFEYLSCHSPELAKRFPRIERAACLAAMHLVLPDETVLVGERAVPEIFRRLPRYRWCAFLFRFPGAGILSGVFYRWFAKNRRRFDKFTSPMSHK